MGVKFVQEGDEIDYTPSADVTAGDVVVQSGLLGVANHDIPANTLGSLTVYGVFDFPKAVSGGIYSAAGVDWYWTGSAATTVAAGNTKIGKSVVANLDAGALARIRLDPSSALQRSNAAQAALTDSTGGSTADATLAAITTFTPSVAWNGSSVYPSAADATAIAAAITSEKNSIAKIAKLVNELRTSLVTAGIIKGS